MSPTGSTMRRRRDQTLSLLNRTIFRAWRREVVREPSDSMPSWPDDNECLRQRLLAMSLQCVVEFAVNGVLCIRHHTQIEHRCT